MSPAHDNRAKSTRPQVPVDLQVVSVSTSLVEAGQRDVAAEAVRQARELVLDWMQGRIQESRDGTDAVASAMYDRLRAVAKFCDEKIGWVDATASLSDFHHALIVEAVRVAQDQSAADRVREFLRAAGRAMIRNPALGPHTLGDVPTAASCSALAHCFFPGTSLASVYTSLVGRALDGRPTAEIPTVAEPVSRMPLPAALNFVFFSPMVAAGAMFQYNHPERAEDTVMDQRPRWWASQLREIETSDPRVVVRMAAGLVANGLELWARHLRAQELCSRLDSLGEGLRRQALVDLAFCSRPEQLRAMEVTRLELPPEIVLSLLDPQHSPRGCRDIIDRAVLLLHMGDGPLAQVIQKTFGFDGPTLSMVALEGACWVIGTAGPQSYTWLEEQFRRTPNHDRPALASLVSMFAGRENLLIPFFESGITCEQLEEAAANYHRVLSGLQRLRDFVAENTVEQNPYHPLLRSVGLELLDRAQLPMLEIALESRGRIEKQLPKPDSLDPRHERRLRRCGQMNEDLALLLATTRIMFHQGNLPLESVRGLDVRVVPGGDIEPELLGEIITTSFENSRAFGTEADAIHAQLLARTQSPDTRFYIASRKDRETSKDRLLSFVRVENIDDQRKYLGSLNTPNVFGGAGIGFALLEYVIRIEGERHDLEAIAGFKDDVLVRYVSEYGFVIGETEPGDDVVRIRRSCPSAIT